MSEKTTENVAYTKEAYTKNTNYNPDLINALLADGKAYTRTEVDKLINNFLNKKE